MEKENLDNGIKPDVNESLALAGLFRKVSTTERMPTKSDNYFTNKNLMAYFVEDGNFSNGNILWWLEEVELPTDEEIKKIDFSHLPHMTQSGRVLIDFGIKWMRDFVLAATAKDNVR